MNAVRQGFAPLALCMLGLGLPSLAEAGFALRVQIQQGSFSYQQDFTDNGSGDLSGIEGFINVSQVFTLDNGTMTFDATFGSSKPLIGTDSSRDMALQSTTMILHNANGTPVQVTLMLTDTNFLPLDQIGPFSTFENSFHFNPHTANHTADFQAFVGLGNTEFQTTGNVIASDLQTAVGQVETDTFTSMSIDAPSDPFSITQVAHVVLVENLKQAQIEAQTSVQTPEPATVVLWGGLLLGLGAVAAVRRRK